MDNRSLTKWLLISNMQFIVHLKIENLGKKLINLEGICQDFDEKLGYQRRVRIPQHTDRYHFMGTAVARDGIGQTSKNQSADEGFSIYIV